MAYYFTLVLAGCSLVPIQGCTGKTEDYKPLIFCEESKIALLAFRKLKKAEGFFNWLQEAGSETAETITQRPI